MNAIILTIIVVQVVMGVLVLKSHLIFEEILWVKLCRATTLPEQVDSSASTSTDACHRAAGPTDLTRSVYIQ